MQWRSCDAYWLVLYRPADLQTLEQVIESTRQHPLCIRAEGLTYRYPGHEHPAVTDLTLTASDGECLAVMGPNGCGKSTLAKLMAGLYEPTSGRLMVLGNNLTTTEGRSAIRGNVGLVFQSPDDQMVATTVEREIAFGPENLGVDPGEIRLRVIELLERFDLQRYAKRSPHLLSGGEKQRLALASVLAMKPQLLILDEVTSLLDPAGRDDIRQLIAELKGKCTLIFITQFPGEALIGDRLILMQDAHIVRNAPPQEIFTDPELLQDTEIDIPLYYRILHAAQCSENPSPRK